ncbi:hypothetical protein BH23CHL5_BH23CHL5_07550 [soil metagenome]
MWKRIQWLDEARLAARLIDQAVAVVGQGPAGAAAAAEASLLGLEVVGFDQFDLLSKDTGGPNFQIHHDTTVWGLYPGWTVAASHGGEPVICTLGP